MVYPLFMEHKMIKVDSLEYTYPHNSSSTIKNINFSIEKGEIFGFLGPSGAGKSTTQKILNRILPDYVGSITYNEVELSTIGNEFYETIGVVFELPNLFSKFTALENLNYFKALYSGETESSMELLEMVGLKDVANKRVSEFSKGMKMRLNFCRGLLNKPKLLFLDEPTSGLDPVNAKLVKDIIRKKQQEGVTIFLTTHNMHTADELCDRVAFLTDGEIKLCDDPRNLKLIYGEKTVSIEWNSKEGSEKKKFSFEELKQNNDFINIIKNEDLETIHTNEATLEDIFIKTTGQTL